MGGTKNGTNDVKDVEVQEATDKEPQGCWENWEQFPKTVFAIFGNEFCERFSYYGMRAVLTLYVANILGYSDQNSIALFHGFIVLCYSSPILGSILADGYIGKFHTILWISLFYACGNIVLAIGACYEVGSKVHPGVDLLGLIIIGLGTGGIKPCVSPFGGDQFHAGQEKMLEAFFHVFYFSINAGALISSFITPMLRVMPCRGQDTCYPAAFGMPAALMVVSVVCFVAGSPWYRRFPPKENVIFEVLKTIHIALRNKRKYSTKRDHWMEHYLDDHECHLSPKCTAKKCHAAQYVDDIKAFLRQVVMCVPMPVFWALYDQQGSVWVLQAVAMDGRLWKGANLLPDQMPTLNAALILIFLPLFEFIIYPIVRKCGIEPTPLRRMTVGGFMIAGCFIISMFVQLAVQKTMPNLPNAGMAHLGIINTLNCTAVLVPVYKGATIKGLRNITLKANSTTTSMVPGDSNGIQLNNLGLGGNARNITWNVTQSCVPGLNYFTTALVPNKAQYTILSMESASFMNNSYVATTKKSETGEGQFKLNVNYLTNNPFPEYGGTMFFCKTRKNKPFCVPKDEDYFEAMNNTWLAESVQFHELKPGTWYIYYANSTWMSAQGYNNIAPPKSCHTCKKVWYKQAPWKEGLNYTNMIYTGLKFEIEGQGGIYSLTLTGKAYENAKQNNKSILMTFYTIAPQNRLSILLQVPQYIVVTAAEILFSVTGLEFSYSQAPLTMKSVVGALWLLTNAFGDLLVLVIEETGAFPNLAYEQLAFAIIMAVVMVIFMLLAIFWYEYSHFIQHADGEEEAEEETEFGGSTEEEKKPEEVDTNPDGEEKKKKRRRKHHHRHREEKENGTADHHHDKH